jgi:hypothetical protein
MKNRKRLINTGLIAMLTILLFVGIPMVKSWVIKTSRIPISFAAANLTATAIISTPGLTHTMILETPATAVSSGYITPTFLNSDGITYSTLTSCAPDTTKIYTDVVPVVSDTTVKLTRSTTGNSTGVYYLTIYLTDEP